MPSKCDNSFSKKKRLIFTKCNFNFVGKKLIFFVFEHTTIHCFKDHVCYQFPVITWKWGLDVWRHIMMLPYQSDFYITCLIFLILVVANLIHSRGQLSPHFLCIHIVYHFDGLFRGNPSTQGKTCSRKINAYCVGWLLVNLHYFDQNKVCLQFLKSLISQKLSHQLSSNKLSVIMIR